jgi:toxin CptA
MHNAPAVSYPAGRSSFAGGAMLLAWIFAGAGLVAWRMQVQAPAAALIAGGAVFVASGAFASRAWLRTPAGTVSWDGLGWTWTARSGAQPGTPEVALDVQRVMLLRWRGRSERPQWLWLEQETRPDHWDDFRRAVYSRASPP